MKKHKLLEEPTYHSSGENCQVMVYRDKEYCLRGYYQEDAKNCPWRSSRRGCKKFLEVDE